MFPASPIVWWRASCKAAAVHFPATQKYFRNAVVTGVPVRQEFFAHSRASTSDDPPTLLVFGGSQGAHAINVAVDAGASRTRRGRFPASTSSIRPAKTTTKPLKPLPRAAGISAEVSPFIDDMPGAFARADLLICRSGASTVAEVAAAGKPAIFVPLPTAADDHQRRNAETLANAGAALLLPQTELTPDRLAHETSPALLRDRDRLARDGQQPPANSPIPMPPQKSPPWPPASLASQPPTM